jgi:hypothetical protein
MWSDLEQTIRGLVDPSICKTLKCVSTNPIIKNGSKKCKLKNLLRVGLETEKPPHNHSVIEIPNTGMIEHKFVITVAAHKDI